MKRWSGIGKVENLLCMNALLPVRDMLDTRMNVVCMKKRFLLSCRRVCHVITDDIAVTSYPHQGELTMGPTGDQWRTDGCEFLPLPDPPRKPRK